MRTFFFLQRKKLKKEEGEEGVSRKFPVFLPYKYSIQHNLTNYTSVKKTITVNYLSAAEVNVLMLLVGRPIMRLNFQNFQNCLLKYYYRITREN